MEDGRLVIFKAIFTNLLESYSSRFNFVLNDIEKILQYSKTDLESFYSTVFTKFPRSDPFYKKVIDDLSQVGATDPENILIFLTKTMKDVIKTKATIFVTLKNCCVFFDSTRESHTMLLYYFSLFFLTDLTCQIIANVSESSSKESNHFNLPNSISMNNFVAYNGHPGNLETPYSSDSSSASNSNSPIASSIKSSMKVPPNPASPAQRSNSKPAIQPTSNRRSNITEHQKMDFYTSPSHFSSTFSTKFGDLSSGTLNMLVQTGSRIAFSQQFYPAIHLVILKQWSVIFSYLSEKNVSDFSSIYSMFSTTSSTDMTLPILLSRFIRFDLNDTVGSLIIDKILQICKMLLKKKTLTNTVLESLSYMLVTLPYNEDIYSKIYSFLKSTVIRKDKSLWNGRILLLTNLYMRYPKIWNKFTSFINKKILREAGNKERLPTSVRCFELAIMGRNVKYECLFWEWGHNPRATPLSYVNFNSYYDSKYSQNSTLFMNNYFAKSDFSICPKLFRGILVHLASLEFTHFVTYITQQFLALESDDPRFLVFLSTIPDINSADFLNHAFSKITKNSIEKFNSFCRERILKELLNSPHITDSSNADTQSFNDSQITVVNSNSSSRNQHGVCVRDFTFLFENLTVENDQKLSVALEAFQLTDKFKILECSHVRSRPSLEKLDLRSLLLRSLQFVFTKDDFNNPKVISIIIELSCHIDNRIATAAFDLCWQFFPDQVDPNLFLRIIVSMDELNDSEAIFVLYSFVFSTLKNAFGKVTIDPDILRLVEIHGFTLLASVFPSTRSLGKGILDQCTKRIKEKSLMSFIVPRMDYIEKTVKKKMLLYLLPSKYETELPPAQTVSFNVALFSHYYDVWLFFFGEILNTLIYSNFIPLFKFFETHRTEMLNSVSKYDRPSNLGITLMYLSTLFHLPTLLKSSYADFSFMFKKFDSDDDSDYSEEFVNADDNDKRKSLQDMRDMNESNEFFNDHRKEICLTIYHLISSKNEKLIEMGFQIVPLLNFSLHPLLIDVLSKVDGDLLYRSVTAVSIMLRLPEVEWPFYKPHMLRLTTFIGNVQYLFIQNELNSPRTIQWNDELEKKVTKYSDVIQNYCIILITMFSHSEEGVSEDIWPYSSRQITIRFLINWATTSSRALKAVRNYASEAIVTITSIGPFITDPGLVDLLPLEYFASLDSKGNSILYNLLHYHSEYLMNHFIDSCYTLSRSLSDLFFDAILHVIQKDELSMIIFMSGKLIFLACVYLYEERPSSQDMIKALLNAKGISSLSDINTNSDIFKYQEIPKIFRFAIEAVFDSFFTVMKMKNRHISATDLIESIRPWIVHIRLLPNQLTCSPYVVPLFNMFTPYEFLMQMVCATESVTEDHFRAIVTLWVELGNIPDHNDLIPLFLSDLTITSPNKKMIEVLLETNAMNLPKLIMNQCTFTFYYHIINNDLSSSFENGQKWLGTLLSSMFTRNWLHMSPVLLKVLHFAFLFRMKGAKKLFYLISRNLNIECFDGPIPRDIMKKIVEQFKDKIEETKIYSIEEWGNEALKWIFGCSSLDLVTTSLIIYNQLMKPYDEQIFYLLIRCASYHLTNNMNSPFLNDFISECFYFFTIHYSENKNVAIKFVLSFLDCGSFLQSGILVETSDFFLTAIRDKAITDNQVIVSIIRPRMTILETDDASQTFLNDIIDLLHQDELEMIALPFKNIAPSVFTSLAPFSSDEIIERCCESSLCKALVHYSIMLTNASYTLQDSIYYITRKIADKIATKYENNKISISRIYKAAVRSISTCKNAMSLIQKICLLMPEVSVMNVYNVYEWDRSVEDVDRIVKILVKDLFEGNNIECLKGINNNTVTISDCISYKQVENFLFCQTSPKILPYAAHAELIEGMKRLTRKPVLNSRASKSRRKIQTFDSMMINSLSMVFNEYHEDENSEYTPISSPKKLILDGIKVPGDSFMRNTTSIDNFLKSVNS